MRSRGNLSRHCLLLEHVLQRGPLTWEDPLGDHCRSQGSVCAGGWDLGAAAEGLRCILEAALAGVGDGTSEGQKNLGFRFSLNSFGHCPVQENPAVVASRSDALTSGLGWKNGDSEGFASKRVEWVGTEVNGGVSTRELGDRQEPLRDPKCSALGHLCRPAQSFPILSAPPLTGFSSGTRCSGHSLNLQAAWDASLPRAPGLAVLPAFLLSLLCPCLSPGSLACQALSTPRAELHPPQLFILELGTRPGVKWVPNR